MGSIKVVVRIAGRVVKALTTSNVNVRMLNRVHGRRVVGSLSISGVIPWGAFKENNGNDTLPYWTSKVEVLCLSGPVTHGRFVIRYY